MKSLNPKYNLVNEQRAETERWSQVRGEKQKSGVFLEGSDGLKQSHGGGRPAGFR